MNSSTCQSAYSDGSPVWYSSLTGTCFVIGTQSGKLEMANFGGCSSVCATECSNVCAPTYRIAIVSDSTLYTDIQKNLFNQPAVTTSTIDTTPIWLGIYVLRFL